MNPLVQQALASIARWGLAILAGYLVKAGIWTGSDAETYVTAGSLALVALLWSLWQKYHGRAQFLTALLPGMHTENDVKAHLDAKLPTPAITTPPSVSPTITVQP